MEKQTRSKEWTIPIKYVKFMGLRWNVQSFWVQLLTGADVVISQTEHNFSYSYLLSVY